MAHEGGFLGASFLLFPVAAAITIERFAPRPERAARLTGVIVIAAGVVTIARALNAV